MERKIIPDMPRLKTRKSFAFSRGFNPIWPSSYVISIVPLSVSTNEVINEKGPSYSSVFSR